ncbi:MAG: portal protein [Armatimonadia bacterium]
MRSDLAQEIRARYTALLQLRQPHESTWQTLAEYCAIGRQTALLKTLAGGESTDKVFDSVAWRAPMDLSNALASSLTPPASRWQRVAPRQADLRADDGAQDWCDDSSIRLQDAVNNSSFLSHSGLFYLDWCCFGTAAMLMDSLPARRVLRMAKNRDGSYAPTGWSTFGGFRWETIPPGTYVLADDHQGNADTLMRDVQMTPRQLRQEFPDATFPDELEAALRDKPHADVPILHAVYPRGDSGRAKTRKPWASVWLYKDIALHEDGYDEFPFIVLRWLRGGGPWGIGQGKVALPDIKTLMTAISLRLEEWALQTRPPIFQRQNAIRGSLNWTPNGITITQGDPNTVLKVHQSTARTDLALTQEERAAQSIKEAFFIDQIRYLPTPKDGKVGGMSEAELGIRQAITLQLLGPQFAQSQPGMKHVVYRGLNIMSRGGALLPLPPSLAARADAELDITFESPMARAQRMGEATAIERGIMFLGQLFQLRQDPAVWDLVDLDKSARNVLEVYGVPAADINGVDVVDQIRQARAQQQQAIQQQQEALAATEGAKNLAPMVKALQGGPMAEAA